MFSLLDKRFTDILVQPARKRNEYSAFCSMVDSADIHEHYKVIFFGDRVDTLPAFDEDISLILTRSKAVSKYSRPELFSSYRYIYQNAPMDYLNDQRTEYDLALRLLRIQLDDGSYENISTNLPEEEFKAKDFKPLYHLRWQVIPISALSAN